MALDWTLEKLRIEPHHFISEDEEMTESRHRSTSGKRPSGSPRTDQVMVSEASRGIYARLAQMVHRHQMNKKAWPFSFYTTNVFVSSAAFTVWPGD